MKKDNEAFEYTYSAQRQREIEKIRSKYLPKQEDKMDLLRKLDKDVTKPGTMYAIIIGLLGCGVFGAGMSGILAMPEEYFGVGIIGGIIGMTLMAVACPVYKIITKRQREKIAPHILALAKEIEDDNI
ncbi:MAG: hypothetical protein J6A75_07700 [Lachnospiraceae bacterium]|nr:hypothetical protein [Lachnospiraceae bacterium]